jgi:hypothetical protein
VNGLKLTIIIYCTLTVLTISSLQDYTKGDPEPGTCTSGTLDQMSAVQFASLGPISAEVPAAFISSGILSMNFSTR